MVLEAFVEATRYFLNVEIWLFIILGVIIGLVFGVIPGISGMLAVALLLPFVFVMKPEHGLPMLMAIISTQFQGGSITAILLNIPGTSPNSATTIDGFPMAQKGEGGRAVGAALMASAAGGAISPLFALAMIPLVLPLIMAIGTPDMVFIILMGLSFIAVLGGRHTVRGLISGGLGLLIAFIGNQATTGIDRFTFGIPYLYDGLPLVPLSLGLFAVPEMVSLAARGGTIARAGVAVQGMKDISEGCKDVFRHWGLWLRSSVIGYIVGVIPGVGAEVATFVSYGQARQTSRHPERYGTGIVEGVIAPESANNAKDGGALLTTLALGIPGSAVYAIIMGAMYMQGITPGPQMMVERLPLAVLLLLIIIVANVVGTVFCLALGARLTKIAYTPSVMLVPVVTVLIFVGSFTYDGSLQNIIVTLAFGALGLAMKSFHFSRPALFLGYVLGLLFEEYFFRALQMKGPLFFLSPVSLTIIAILICLFNFGSIRKLFERRRPGGQWKAKEA